MRRPRDAWLWGALALALAVGGCERTATNTPDARTANDSIRSEAPAASVTGSAVAPAPKGAPSVVGPWSTKIVTGAPFATGGIVTSARGPLLYVGDFGGGAVRIGTLADGGAWKLDTIGSSALLAVGHIAARGDHVATTGRILDMSPGRPLSSSVVWLEGEHDPITILGGCSMIGDHAVTFDSKGPVVVAMCKDALRVMSQSADGWVERASLATSGIVYQAVTDGEDRVHARFVAKGTMRDVAFSGKKAVEVAAPRGAELNHIGECGGTVYGAFVVVDEAASTSTLAIGKARGDQWAEMEPAEGVPIGAAMLAFDDHCNVLLVDSHEVWSRGASVWHRSGSILGDIKAVVAYRGTLYAAYEEIHDGVMVGIASAPLVAEP